jgi:hypothetical protein
MVAGEIRVTAGARTAPVVAPSVLLVRAADRAAVVVALAVVVVVVVVAVPRADPT